MKNGLKIWRERQRAIEEARSVCSDNELFENARSEINANCRGVDLWLRKMPQGFRLNDDFSRNEEDYCSSELYRIAYNHIEHHMFEMREVQNALREGHFLPKYVGY